MNLVAQVSMIGLMICSWVLNFEMMVWCTRRGEKKIKKLKKLKKQIVKKTDLKF